MRNEVNSRAMSSFLYLFGRLRLANTEDGGGVWAGVVKEVQPGVLLNILGVEEKSIDEEIESDGEDESDGVGGGMDSSLGSSTSVCGVVFLPALLFEVACFNQYVS